LEDLDAFAGNIATRHADDNNPKSRPLTIVTASVDEIQLWNTLHPDRDLKMEGSVTYVGKSSMEVEIKVSQISEEISTIALDAIFTFVARDSNGKAAQGFRSMLKRILIFFVVNPLLPQTEQEIQRFQLGEENKRKR
jgi:acyl-coenzyme A thioesterase 9